MSTIQKTQNYNQFKFFESNRDVNCNHLIESIKKKNLLATHPILVTPELYVIDGQHRLEAAKYLQTPIYYIIDQKLDEDCIPTCQVQRGWVIPNFINFYRRKIPDYQFVYDMVQKHKLSEHFILDCLCDRFGVFKVVRDGSFRIKGDKAKFDKLFDMYCEIEKKCIQISLKKKMTQQGKRALFNIIKRDQYNHKRFLEKIDAYRQCIVDAFKYRDTSTIEEYILKNIYNHKIRHDENRITA